MSYLALIVLALGCFVIMRQFVRPSSLKEYLLIGIVSGIPFVNLLCAAFAILLFWN